MANFDELLEKVMNIDDNGEVVTESVMSPVRKLKDKLKKVKDEKPSEYSDDTEVRKFIDESYDTIDDAAKILEKEPKELRKKDIQYLVSFCITYIGGFLLFCSTPLSGGIMLFSGMGLMILSIVITAVYSIISYIRANDDKDAYNDLQKIRNALKKVQDKKMPDSYKKKIADLLTAIDDASEEISARIRVKESVEDIKLNIYESCHAGEITEEERDILLGIVE